MSQNALLQLMDQELLHPDDAEVQICPVIIKLTEPDSSDDFRTEAITVFTNFFFFDFSKNLCSTVCFFF